MKSNRSKMLNVGCGRNFHEAWVNLDLDSNDEQVIKHDLLTGIPFEANYFDCVYHSHLLEHLAPKQGEELLKECWRVLKPGGILRVAVPDLEQIARLYLATHERACDGDEAAAANYDWMKLELLDQMVRAQSGGLMGQYMTDPAINNADFIRSRIGKEIDNCHHDQSSVSNTGRSGGSNKLSRRIRRVREVLARKAIALLLGKSKLQAFDEGSFRQTGEIHRWMYDQFSLNVACQKCGFESGKVFTAFESQIAEFESYQLDSYGKSIRKPDSLFMEFIKPSNSVVSEAA